MNAKEIIEVLKKHPQEMKVVVLCRDGGLEDATFIESIPIRLNQDIERYYSRYKECETGEENETAILIAY